LKRPQYFHLDVQCSNSTDLLIRGTAMGNNPIAISNIRQAMEGRNAAGLKALYADNAVITIIDTMNPPSKPKVIAGAADIGAYLDDVCGRDMTHKLEHAVVDDRHLAYVEGCRYADGMRVTASAMAELGPGGIVKQTIVQAWDN
jgi:hypothetical protein